MAHIHEKAHRLRQHDQYVRPGQGVAYSPVCVSVNSTNNSDFVLGVSERVAAQW